MEQQTPKFDIKSFPLKIFWKRGVLAVFVILVCVILTHIILAKYVVSIMAFLILTMPVVNFVFPSRTLFFEDYFEKIQLFQNIQFDYSKYKFFETRQNGVVFFKNKRRAGEMIYIFDNELKNSIVAFLKTKIGDRQ